MTTGKMKPYKDLKNFYDIAGLEHINRDYAYPITEREVEKVNRLISLIRKAREQDRPADRKGVV